MKQETRTTILMALCLPVLAAIAYSLRGAEALRLDDLLIHILFYAFLIPLIGEATSPGKPTARSWTDFLWLAMGAVLALFFLLQTTGTIPGGPVELTDWACALLLLGEGVIRVARPKVRPTKQVIIYLVIAAAAVIALCLSSYGDFFP